MKIPVALALLIATGCLAPAQTNDTDLGSMLDAAQQWAQDNLDENVLAALQNVDRTKVEDFLKNFQTHLQGDYVLDVAPLKDAANAILPLLDAQEETQPYAAWLRERLDYFEVAEELKQLAPPSPRPEPGRPVPPPANPTFKAEQEIWIKKVSPRPWPKGAAQYVPKLKTIFAEERIPEALVWLAEVESGFDARARSPVGAMGMFQLMPATARQNGLSLWPFDQRRQPEAAAHASAQYLRRLYAQFADWRLVVAAYNAGEGTVQRLLQRYGTKNFERIAPHLPAETQMYVPKVEATILKREGLQLEKLPSPSAERK